MKYFWILSVLIVFGACNEVKRELPYYGPIDFNIDGDTIQHQLVNFELYNQLGKKVTLDKYKGKVQVAEFFFSSCPSICPIMNSQMLRVQEAFIDSSEFQIVSITVDPENDTIESLKEYANRIGVVNSKWDLLTGERYQVSKAASRGYLQAAIKDGVTLNHSEYFVLVDQDFHLRGFYDGTDSLQVDSLIKDIKLLLE